jgi:hypothetical protein
LFIVIYNREFFGNIERGEVKLKRLESSNIPVPLKKVCTMLFDNSPIKKLSNFFFGIDTIRIFDKKDIFFDIFKISSNFEIVNNLVHFLYRKIFS